MSTASGRFSIVPARAVEDQRIGNAAFRVLSCLGTYADRDGWCWPSTSTIGERVGMARSTAHGHIETLIAAGYVERHKRQRADGSTGSNRYRLLFDRALLVVGGEGTLSNEPTPDVGKPDTTFLAVPTPETAENMVSDSPNGLSDNPNGCSAQTRTAYERTHRTKSLSVDFAKTNELFENFWRQYPSRRPHPNPQRPARLKFEAAVRRGIDPATIIAGATAYASHIARDRTDPRYIAQAATWLGQERWTDDLAQLSPSEARRDSGWL